MPQIARHERGIGNFGSIQSIWAFIDGTVQVICRPGEEATEAAWATRGGRGGGRGSGRMGQRGGAVIGS